MQRKVRASELEAQKEKETREIMEQNMQNLESKCELLESMQSEMKKD
jgi:hypothetical protein